MGILPNIAGIMGGSSGAMLTSSGATNAQWTVPAEPYDYRVRRVANGWVVSVCGGHGPGSQWTDHIAATPQDITDIITTGHVTRRLTDNI